MSFYHILVHIHSSLRWILLFFVLASIVAAAFSKTGVAANKSNALGMGLWSMATAHVQLIVGLVLYFISPKVIFAASSMSNGVYRFFLLEHILVMLIAIALITIGYIKAKKASDPRKQNRNILIYFIIALVLILSRIPWPFMQYGGGWI